MEQFEINLLGETYTIQELENVRYKVIKDGKVVGILSPSQGDVGILWRSDEIERDFAYQLGELIEEHDM